MDCNKTMRLLVMHDMLTRGEGINKAETAARFGVNERSIQRDIEELRNYFACQEMPAEIRYQPKENQYRLIARRESRLDNGEILAVCTILLESRSLRRDEMMPILDKLIDCTVPEDSKKAVKKLIANEAHHYIEPHHDKKLLRSLWEIGQAIQEQRAMEIEYERMKEPTTVKRRVLPAGLMFSEYYFYLTAFLEDKSGFENPDDLFPTIYRIDRIRSFKVLNEHFRVPYSSRFEEGEFRKRVQFMYGGKLQTVRFTYTGPSVEAVLDRLPTAKIICVHDGAYEIRAEVFGKGIGSWLRSQGEYVKYDPSLLNK